MRNLVPLLAIAVMAVSLAPSPAHAEDTETISVEILPENLQLQAPEELSYEDYKVQELERTALRSRNALIGTAVAAAVGLALVIPAAGQCDSVDKSNGDSSYECTRAGNALLGVGSPLLFGGLTGAVVSGIILGVRKGKLRRLNDSFAAPPVRAVRVDPSGRLVF